MMPVSAAILFCLLAFADFSMTAQNREKVGVLLFAKISDHRSLLTDNFCFNWYLARISR